MRPGHAFSLVKESVGAWSDDRASTMGAALSYYALFSIAPLLVISIAIAGLVFGPEVVRGAVFAQLADLMGADGATAIREMLAHASHPATGGFATLGSAAMLLLGASSVFGELQNSLDAIWHAPVRAQDKGGLEARPPAAAVVRDGARVRLPDHGVAATSTTPIAAFSHTSARIFFSSRAKAVF
jgi:virulence factor BrkB